jgi:hypothetical protein
MINLRLKLSHFTARKVPALSLMLVATMGMVAGVMAASMLVTQKSGTNQSGTYNNSTGAITDVDNGLAVIANSVTANYTTAVTWGATGASKQVYYSSGASSTAGNWMDYIAFSTTLVDTSTHTVTVTIRNGIGSLGTTLATFSTALWTAPTTTSSTATITIYVDLGVQSITSPLTVYVSVT